MIRFVVGTIAAYFHVCSINIQYITNNVIFRPISELHSKAISNILDNPFNKFSKMLQYDIRFETD